LIDFNSNQIKEKDPIYGYIFNLEKKNLKKTYI